MNTRNMRSIRLYVCLASVMICILLLARTLLKPTKDLHNRAVDRETNGVWLGVEWVSGDRSTDDIIALADELTRQQITYVFVFTSFMNPQGEFNPTYSHAAELVYGLKAANPSFHVQAWIGLPLATSSRNGYVELENATVRRKIVSLCVDLVQGFGFDGIHVDAEPIVDGDTSVLVLLEELRHGTGSNATISMATRRILPDQYFKLPIIAKLAWQADYYRQVAQRVDQVAVMTYDSALPLPFLYRYWVSTQVVQLGQVLDNVPVELLIGIPTSEEWTLTHWPNAENITSGLQGVVDGLNNRDARPSAVSGVAIYPHWEMDVDEWVSYQSLWLNR